MKNLVNKLKEYQFAFGLVLINLVSLIVFSPEHFYFELLQSMAFQIMLGAGVMGVILLLSKQWVASLMCLLSFFLLTSKIPLFGPQEQLPSNVKIAHFNVLKHNKNYQATLEAALESEATFISFNELTPQWECELIEGLAEDYPYYFSQLAPENHSFGIAVFSKTPISNEQTHYWGNPNIPTLTGDIALGGKIIHFVAVHSIPPMSKELFAKRNNHLHAVKTHLAAVEGSKLLIGDLNAVSWSPVLEQIRGETNIVDSRKSWTPTFPSWSPLFAIPIDHIFHSPDITCTKFYSLENTSSDHRGIIGEYYVPEMMVINQVPNP